MKQFYLIILVVLGSQVVQAQPVVFEGLAGNDYLFYQHLIAKKFSAQSRFGLMHIANVTNRYQTDPKKGGRPNELMNQAYLTTRMSNAFTLLTGMFYTNNTGIRASAGIQYAKPFRTGLVVLVPRVDIEHRGSIEMMAMVEYQPVIKNSVKLYTRLQVMSNYGAYQHNRSYQRIRLGIDIKGTQVGLGLNMDEYGRESRIYLNGGVFIRKAII